MSAPFRGIVAYPITPFTSQDQVDQSLLADLVTSMVKAGVHAIAPLGSTGVLPYLSDDERKQVTKAVVETVAGRVPTLVGVSSLTTERAVHHAKDAEDTGATAVMILPMSYWKLTEAEILRHFEQVARAISIPIAVYNNPATAGIDLTPRLIAKLLQIPNVTMVKESTGDVNRMHQLAQLCGENVAYYNGSNPLAYSALAAGARGWCTAAPQIIPRLSLELYELIQQGDLAAARRCYHRQLPFLQFLVAHGIPRVVSAALEMQRLRGGHLRAPLRPLEDPLRVELHRILSDLEVLPIL